METNKFGYIFNGESWQHYYNQEELLKDRPKKLVYEEVYENNKDNLDKLALEYFGTKINFKTFFDNVNKTAKAFEEYGIKKGDFVTICAAGIPEMAYSFYALSKLGAVANMMAPYFDKNDLANRINDCESDVLIVMDTFYEYIKDSIKNSRIKNVIVIPSLNSSFLRLFKGKYQLENFSNELFWNQFIKDGRRRNDSLVTTYEDELPLAMVYSSGTTGASKGILLSNDSFQNSIHAYLASGIDLASIKKSYQIIPPWYSTGLSTSMHLPLSCSATVFMDPRFEREIFVKNIIKNKINCAIAPTSMYEGFLDLEGQGVSKKLKHFSNPFEGGEPYRKEVGERIDRVLKDNGSPATVRVGYGQCECGATVTTQTPRTGFCNGSVGIPLPGIILRIVDENHNKLGIYERGEVLVNTKCGMLGYYKNPTKTDEYFYTDENGIKWSCTGDMGYLDENGELYILGRMSDYTMVNDKKVYNFDIENIIMELSEVKICDVLDKKDRNGDTSLVAHIVFDDQYMQSIRNDFSLLQEELYRIQDAIYEGTKDIDMVPHIFKVRTSFPYAKSGKRDILKLKSETEGFIELPLYKPNIKIKKINLQNSNKK